MITVETRRPYTLVRKIRELIDERTIEKWSYDDDGDFTLNLTQWRNKAWFHAIRYKARKVEFVIISPAMKSISRTEYAVYHGKFIEMLIKHLPHLCDSISSTPQPALKDHITPPGYED